MTWDEDEGSTCRPRISQVLVVNTLCCAIGIVGAWDAWWVIRYWGAIESLYGEAIRWMRML